MSFMKFWLRKSLQSDGSYNEIFFNTTIKYPGLFG